jgi:hypothetical protein
MIYVLQPYKNQMINIRAAYKKLEVTEVTKL